jgi:hypothetical protein
MRTLPVREFLFAGWLGLVATPVAFAADPPAAAEEKVAAADAAEENPVVCKRIAVTGSRVKKEKVCKTQREWNAGTQRAQEFMRGIERGGSHQPGGEGLPSGG